VDIGTTSLKAALITAEGAVVSFCSVPFDQPHDRFIACAWYEAFLCAVRKLASKTSGKVTIKGISVSGNGPTVVADCGYTVFWNDDFSDIKLPSDTAADSDIASSLFIRKLLALKEWEPEIYKKSKKLFSGPEFFIYILTGKAVTILPEERFLPAYWNDKSCRACNIDFEKLPPFTKVGSNCGIISSQAFADIASVWNKGIERSNENTLEISQSCSVFAGGPDFVVALIGTGTLYSGRLCDRCGSSEGLNFCSDRPLSGRELRILPSVIPGLWNASYLIPDSGEMSEAERLNAVEKGINYLKQAAAEAGLLFPSEMAVTGGQTNDELLLKGKAERLGIKLLRPADNNFVHSELLGDACAGWFGLGIYKSLQTASAKLVRLTNYENL